MTLEKYELDAALYGERNPNLPDVKWQPRRRVRALLSRTEVGQNRSGGNYDVDVNVLVRALTSVTAPVEQPKTRTATRGESRFETANV